MSDLALAWRFARRELRGGIGGFRIFILCLALGVAVIAAVGLLAASVNAGLKQDSRALLGGDVELRLVLRPADAAQKQYLTQHGALSEVAELRAMARSDDGKERSLIELKAVDSAYPLYGAVTLDPAQSLDDALAERDGTWGAAVAPGLLQRLGLKLGDSIRIGQARFVIRATVEHEPDAIGTFSLGPKVLIAAPALAATDLLIPGGLVAYAYRLRLPSGSDVDAFVAQTKSDFPSAGWRIRQFGNVAPSLEGLLDRITVFLTLVGLTTLLVGGVGIANSVKGYLAQKIETIATLKCLGAPMRLVFATYLLEILVLAALGIGLGLVIGTASPYAIVPLLPASLPIAARVAIYPAPLLLALGFGLLVTFAFALWPLAEAAEIAPASLFRSLVAPERRRPRAAYLLAVGLAGAALAALAIASAADRKTALWFILGAVGSLLAFRIVAFLVAWVARRAGRPRHPGLRLALANLHRPGAPTGGVIASLGLGLTVLVAIALIEGNLAREIEETIPERAPSFFFIDIQPDQIGAFDKLLAGMSGVERLGQVPSLRGRIVKLKDTPVEEAQVAPEARWAIQSERGVTWASALPKGSTLVAGKWWPADYHGPPLVSFDTDLARGMGLKLGDSITINVLGRDITATIANLRQIDWTSLGINFVLVLAPGALDGAPQTYIATARATPEREADLARAVTDQFPNVSAIPVKDALESLAAIVAAIGAAMRVTAAITLAAGALVLAGAVAAEHRRRVYEAVVLKVLGATRGEITRAFLIEYGLLGLAAAVIAGAIGTLAGYLVLTYVMHRAWGFLPGAVLSTAILSTLLTLAVGLAGTWRALGAKPAPYLRNE